MSKPLSSQAPARQMRISINTEKTGARLKRLLKSNGYTVQEIKTITGVSSEQAIYKWFRGKSIPSLENLLILSRLTQTPINELLVTDEEPS